MIYQLTFGRRFFVMQKQLIAREQFVCSSLEILQNTVRAIAVIYARKHYQTCN